MHRNAMSVRSQIKGDRAPNAMRRAGDENVGMSVFSHSQTMSESGPRCKRRKGCCTLSKVTKNLIHADGLGRDIGPINA